MKVKTSIADHHADAGGHREPEHGGGGGGGDEVLQYSFEVTSLASYGQMVYKKCKKKLCVQVGYVPSKIWTDYHQ